ncbi:MAG: hypothetical protein AB7P76_05705 [Candidatus Melainabacteria bacterium]
MSKKWILLIWLAVLCGLGLLLARLSAGNSFYIEAYRPQVQQSQAIQQLQRRMKGQEVETSGEPRAPGFRESDINKHEGDGFRTW